MTLDEAQKVAAIIATADGGCNCCVEALCEQMGEKFPEFEWTYRGEYVEVTQNG